MEDLRTQTEIKITLYKNYGASELGTCYTETNNAAMFIDSEFWLNGDYWPPYALIKELEDGTVELYSNCDGNLEYIQDMKKCDFVTIGCYVDNNLDENDDDKGKKFECATCKHRKECIENYEWKREGEDTKGFVKSCSWWFWGEIYFNGRNQVFKRFEMGDPLNLKLRKIEEIDEIYRNDIRMEDYDFWRDTDTDDIWLRRLPSEYSHDYFITWKKLRSKDIEDLKEWIKDYDYSYKKMKQIKRIKKI
jgi:hypothetical protein